MNICGFIMTQDQICFKFLPDLIRDWIPDKCIDFLTVNTKKCTYQSIDLNELGIRICVAQLPFTAKQLLSIHWRSIEKVCNEVTDYFALQGVGCILLSQKVRSDRRIVKKIIEKENLYIPNGKTLLLSLIEDILKKIAKILGLGLLSLDMGIISRYFDLKCIYLIDKLSPHAKYITLITEDMEKAKNYALKLYDETGLVIRVKEEADDSLAERQFVVALNGLSKVISAVPLKSSTLIFDMDDCEPHEYRTNNIIIDNVSVHIPKNILSYTQDMSAQPGLNSLMQVESCESLGQIEGILFTQLGIDPYHLEQENYRSIYRAFHKLEGKINGLYSYKKAVEIQQLEKLAKKIKCNPQNLIDINHAVVYNR